MDTRASIEAFIQAQSIEYQEYVAKSRDLESTIQHQQSLLNQRIIPNVYRPKLLRTTNSHLTEEFNEKYDRLFTEHLNKVLTSNIINLELQKAAVTSIITQTEHHLCSSSLSQDDNLLQIPVKQQHTQPHSNTGTPSKAVGNTTQVHLS